MSAISCFRLTAFFRSVQASGPLGIVVPRHYFDWRYSKKEGVPREVVTMLTQDYDFSRKSIMNYLNKSRRKAVIEDHKYVPERHSTLGPDLATAHFLVRRGAMVKFVGPNTWFKRDKAGNMYLPNHYVPGMHLEAIDATGIQMSHAAFDNMIQLEHLRYMNFSKCVNFDDWCLARMHQFQSSLEFLDISDCWEVTENGIACLHVLKKLQGLKLSGLPKLQDGLLILLLEEALPQCTIFGIEPEKLDQLGINSDSRLLEGSKSTDCENVANTEQSKVSEENLSLSGVKSQR